MIFVSVFKIFKLEPTDTRTLLKQQNQEVKMWSNVTAIELLLTIFLLLVDQGMQ